MEKAELYHYLMSYFQNYIQVHPRTAELDIAILQKFAEGRNTILVAMEVPCAEATVYRAVNRVREFLNQKTKLWQSQSFQVNKNTSTCEASGCYLGV